MKEKEGTEKKETKNPQMIEVMMTYFLYHFNNRSQYQHRNMITFFKAFVKCFPDIEDEYLKKAEKMVKKPIVYFLEKNKDFLTRDQERKLDKEFTLASLDFLYYRDTSYANQLKVDYAVTYKRPNRSLRALTLLELLEVMAFIRDELTTDLNEIARQMEINVPVVLPAVEKQEQRSVGIGAEKTLDIQR